MVKRPLPPQQITSRNDFSLVRVPDGAPDTLAWWIEQYFRFEVTTAASSQQVQRRDLDRFLGFLRTEEGEDQRIRWTPRLSRAFQEHLRTALTPEGRRSWSDRTANRMLAHLKTFAKWVHKLAPFPLGDPMAKIQLRQVGAGLEVERALSDSERRRLLDAADLLPETGGRSRDRNRYRGQARPRRKNFRPWRNRALVYCLVETGMRRAGAVHLDLAGVDWSRRALTVREKGGAEHSYQISAQGLAALRDYAGQERPGDAARGDSPAFFLAAAGCAQGQGRLSVRVINQIWNQVCRLAGVAGKTPHSARHAMGRHLIAKTGNIAAVQRQLGHRNVSYSVQYARITRQELQDVLDERE